MINLKKENIFCTLVLLYLFFISSFQATNNHWSARIDQDIYIIVNSLLVYSGYEQDYIDHPAFSTFFILGGVYKILSFFLSNFTFSELINSDNIDQNLQNLFSIARFLNSIYFFIYTFLIFKILIELNIRRSLCFTAILLLLTFHSVYEVLFLIRSEILSIVFALLSFYLLIKFAKYEKSLINCFFSGFFLCCAFLAKIQIIFLVFTFILIFPFLFTYYNYQNVNDSLIKNNKFFVLSSILFALVYFGYIVFEFFYAFELLIKQFALFQYLLALPHFVDPILYTLFIFFYFLTLKYLSLKNNIKFTEFVSLFYLIIYGAIFCVLSIYLLDYIGLISFNDTILLLLANPVHKMSPSAAATFNTEISGGFNIGNIIQGFKDIFYNSYKVFPNRNLAFKFGGTFIGTLDFYRVLNTMISGIIVLIFIFNKKTKKNLPIIFLLLIGITIQILSFGLRDSLGYNIYLYPIFLILIFISLNQLKNKFIISSFLLTIFIVSISEFYFLRNFYKLQFARENRIYSICKIDKWKNSENYIKNHDFYSHVPLTEEPKEVLLYMFAKKDKKFLINYCEQQEKKASWKTNFFNIKIN